MTQQNSTTEEPFDVNKIPSSRETYNDPTLYEVLKWHISVCRVCHDGLEKPPPAFGTADTRHCQEYYGIAEEYSEYERDYIRWANP